MKKQFLYFLVGIYAIFLSNYQNFVKCFANFFTDFFDAISAFECPRNFQKRGICILFAIKIVAIDFSAFCSRFAFR